MSLVSIFTAWSNTPPRNGEGDRKAVEGTMVQQLVEWWRPRAGPSTTLRAVPLPVPGRIFDAVRGSAGMNQFDYQVDIFPLSQADGGGHAAVAPELPGCRSDGETPQRALDNIYDARAVWIEAAGEMGRAVPQPRRAAA